MFSLFIWAEGLWEDSFVHTILVAGRPWLTTSRHLLVARIHCIHKYTDSMTQTVYKGINPSFLCTLVKVNGVINSSFELGSHAETGVRNSLKHKYQ